MEAEARFAAARVARLATADAAGVPHLVPVTFALDDGAIVFAVDHKPKRSTDLRRLRNIAANPAVSFLADGYDEDWSRLWWVRADGTARVLGSDPAAIEALRAKYPQYRERPPEGPVVRTEVTAWRGWSASA
ncbi:TIGR03668 family PPOX class F420-dependent oxidoreductase [Amycolatopsis acidiphila]|uniref:TIGR03668 family PPOX class F420-dependent oxidoreductase n=1 Tax=Amycolatopsis acidiphila TaxID=715473 RepID=A0A558AAS3_9PSEU|nr:TIGR03668 family PPOX class F420-dependent oxidoreductase [Amycolatopsis acidiphila]TVT21368.1 TIGR03668 family PPOX class F420-dependent oxidoreductase [Amycolatopsis acidiphila]UIJ63588.1 TIGR03668 family PPOX class F420-dependent oxidoreductase [Amycolatopsis acidiphila]GHG68082.1 PPOX class F420-dependent oxidoreductase [Amycolatopsis acidiphila]